MDKDQIRQTLSGYRPEIYQDDDPLIAADLEAAKADPELAEWLEGEIDFDRQFSQALATIEPPADAKAILLQEGAAICDKTKPARFGKPNRQVTWAIAALLLFSAVMAGKFFLFPAPVEFTAHAAPTEQIFREQMAYFASQRFILDETFATNSESAKWLKGEHYPTLEQVPGELVQYEGMGCKKIDWQGRKVGLICFKNGEGDIVHLFVLDHDTLTPDSGAEKNFGDLLVFHERETKGWRDGQHLYLLVGSEPGVSIGQLM